MLNTINIHSRGCLIARYWDIIQHMEAVDMLSMSKIQAVIKKIAPEYSIKTVKVFGSYAAGTANSNSDVDMLVEFTAPAVSLLTLASLKYRLEGELNTNVDVIHGPLEKDSMIILGKVVPVYEQ